MTSASLSDLQGADRERLELCESAGHPSADGGVSRHAGASSSPPTTSNLSLSPSRTLGLVGESGCGKSVTLRSVIAMIPKPGEVLEGEVLWHGRNIVGRGRPRGTGRARSADHDDLPGPRREPEPRLLGRRADRRGVPDKRLGLGKKEAAERTSELLRSVGIPSPAERARDYPHQLSGGMRQRVMIAMAVAPGPELAPRRRADDCRRRHGARADPVPPRRAPASSRGWR